MSRRIPLFPLLAAAAVLLPSARAAAQDNASGKVSDNLYELSRPHLKDPLQWPSIWSLAPQSGLPTGLPSIRGSQTQGRSASAPEAIPAKAEKPKADWRASEEKRTRGYLRKLGPLATAEREDLAALDPVPVRQQPVGPIKHYLSQSIALTAPFLADPSGGGFFAGECRLTYSSSNESEILQLFDEVVLDIGAAAGVKPGDLYRTYAVGETYRTYGSGRGLGRLIETNGIVEVVRVGKKSSAARLVKCFGTISRSTRACPLTAPPEVAATSYRVATDDKVAAQVVWVAGGQQFPQPYSFALVDRGAGKGYRAGDMVLFFNRSGGKMTDKVLGDGIVVHVGDKSSTILIRDLLPGIINRGDFSVIVQSAVL
jgi:hypothetical protein